MSLGQLLRCAVHVAVVLLSCLRRRPFTRHLSPCLTVSLMHTCNARLLASLAVLVLRDAVGMEAYAPSTSGYVNVFIPAVVEQAPTQ